MRISVSKRYEIAASISAPLGDFLMDDPRCTFLRRVSVKVDVKPPRLSKVHISPWCGCGAAPQSALSRSGEPMATKKKRIVRYTTDELKAMEKAGKVRSDWKRAARMPVPDG